MFLNYTKAANCFRIIKVWEMRNGRAVATANDDIARSRARISTINNADEQTVLGKILTLMEGGLK